MKFNRLVREIVWPIFKEHNFQFTEHSDYYVDFKSKTIEIVLSYDERGKSNMLFIGKADGFLWSVDSDVIKYLFGTDVKLDFLSENNFFTEVLVLFENQANPLLNSDLRMVDLIKNYVEKKSRKYTLDLIEKQNRAVAYKAWKTKII